MLPGEDAHREAMQRLPLKFLAAGCVQLLQLAVQIFRRHAGEGDRKYLVWVDPGLKQARHAPLHRERFSCPGPGDYPYPRFWRRRDAVSNTAVI